MKKKETSKKTVMPPKNIQAYKSPLFIGLPPCAGVSTVTVIVYAVQNKEDDEDQDSTTRDKGGEIFMPMKAHQHGSALKIKLIVPRWADKTEDRDKLKVDRLGGCDVWQVSY